MLDQLECMMACRIISWSIIACHVFTLTKSQIHYTARSKVSFINVFFSAVLLICSRIFIHKIFFLHQIAFIVILQIQLERDTWDTDRKIQTWHFWHVVWSFESSLAPFCVEFMFSLCLCGLYQASYYISKSCMGLGSLAKGVNVRVNGFLSLC